VTTITDAASNGKQPLHVAHAALLESLSIGSRLADEALIMVTQCRKPNLTAENPSSIYL
jgi:hypothetical protein